MKLSFLLFIFFLHLNNTYAAVNTRISLVSNTFDSDNGTGTLIVNVEAYSTTGNVLVDVFENAIQIDSTLSSQIESISDVTFSNQLFPVPFYSQDEEFTPADGSISFRYEFNPLTLFRTSINNDTSKVVTITIVYQLADAFSSISWYEGLPDFLVTNQAGQQMQGIEEPVPDDLINFPLPVELNSFTVSAKGSAAELKWQTETEVNNFGFEVERRNLPLNPLQGGEIRNGWEKIGFVAGNGNSNSVKNYSFIDENPAGGSWFKYRLKQIDNDGSFSYSEEVEVELTPEKFELFQNYPNPFNPVTKIKFSIPNESRVRLDIYNIAGEHMTTLLDKNMGTGFYEVNFNGLAYSSGTYIYRITADGLSSVKKMLLVK